MSLPKVERVSPTNEKDTAKSGDVLDISTVGVRLIDGPRKGKMIEFDVTTNRPAALEVQLVGENQRRVYHIVISVVISSNEKDLIDSLNRGIVLPEMQFYSPIAIFKGKGVISGKTKIRSGPKQGDYMLDIKIESG